MCKSRSFNCLKKICQLDKNKYVISKTLNNYVAKKEQWEDFVSNIVYIFVGDNPGEVEEKFKEYFYYNPIDGVKSKTGENTHKFIENFLEISPEEVKRKILFLNKSLKSTKVTKSLYNEDCLDDESLILITDLIGAIVSENKKVFICLFGIDSFHAEYFTESVNEFLKIKMNRLGLYPHPSRRQPISLKEQDEIREDLKEEKYTRSDFFKKYGSIRLANEKESEKDIIKKCKQQLEKK